MSLIPSGEIIAETKKCRISGKEFFVTDKDLEFYDKISPVFAGNKYLIPSPTLCPEERMRQLSCFRNDRHLYSRQSSLGKKNIISVFNQDSPHIVYSPEEFHSDGWSAIQYGQQFSFDKEFFPQFHALWLQVPQLSLNQSMNENSLFCHEGLQNKSCYLLYNGSQNENVYFSHFSWRNKSCLDCSYVKDSELCYQTIDSQKNYCLFYSRGCTSCKDSQFLVQCESCVECFGCINQKHQKYRILNVQYSEGEYRDYLRKFNSSVEFQIIFFKKFSQLQAEMSYKHYMGYGNENVVGNTIYNSKNIFDSYEISSSENISYSVSAEQANNVYDCIMCRNSDFCYFNEVSTINCSNVCFSSIIFNQNAKILYSRLLNNTSDIFGCVSLHSHEHHCILNKPYSVSEYEQLCGKIIDHMRSTGEWGEFFPHELSPFGYNETVAQEYFPLTESEVKSRGWNWYDEPVKTFEGTSLTPLGISQYDERVVGFEIAQKNIDTLLTGVVKCEVSGKPFKIIPQELAFYIEHSLPLPTKHPDQRHRERMDLRNPRTLYERTCSECMKAITTTYSPDRSERVVCEECYRKLVY